MIRKHTAEVYADHAGEWRWTVYARNGRKVADSSEGYTRRADCVKAFKKLFGRRVRLTTE